MNEPFIVTDGYDRSKNPRKYKVRSISLNEAKLLNAGDKINFIDTKGKLRSAKINGMVKTWKRNPNRIEIPCKYGMYEFHTFRSGVDLHRIVIILEDNDRKFANL